MKIKVKKQVDALKNLKLKEETKTIKKYDDEDSPWISKEKETFNELADKRLNKINELDKKLTLMI